MPTITPGPDAFQNAYQAANAGDVVTVAAGKYPRQQVGSGEQDVKAVTFQGEHGAVLEGLDNYASNVVFDGLMLDAGGVQSSGAVFENHGAPGADHVTFRNGAIGNVADEKGALVAGGYFTFENVAFHDVVLKTDGVHLEGCYAIVVPHLRDVIAFVLRRRIMPRWDVPTQKIVLDGAVVAPAGDPNTVDTGAAAAVKAGA